MDITTPDVPNYFRPGGTHDKVQERVKTYTNLQPSHGEAAARALVARDISLERIRKELKQTAEKTIVEPLTGLFNRRFFDSNEKATPPVVGELERLYQIAKRDGSPLGVIMCDIDHFKGVNDGYGHQVGDEILKNIAHLIQSAIRKGDVAVRYGGDEIVLLLPGTDSAGVYILAEKLRKAVEGYHYHSDDHHNRPDNVTLSLGGASFDPTTPSSITEQSKLINVADEAARFSKENGRNRTSLAKETQSGTWHFT